MQAGALDSHRSDKIATFELVYRQTLTVPQLKAKRDALVAGLEAAGGLSQVIRVSYEGGETESLPIASVEHMLRACVNLIAELDPTSVANPAASGANAEGTDFSRRCVVV